MELHEKGEKVKAMIEFLVQKCIKKNWRLQGGPVNIPTIVRGLDRMKVLYPYSDMADERIVDFVVYQIYRYRDLIGNYDKGWNLSWCFSDNAVQKFKNQFINADGKSGMNYFIDQWLNDGSLDRHKLVRMIGDPQEHPLRKYIYMESEELTKRRFLNTEIGLLFCMNNTTGWSPKSRCCKECQYIDKCVEHFERTTPELIRLRKESV
jgi:hypothetical protein